MNNFFSFPFKFAVVCVLFSFAGCASTTLKGVDSNGQKVYLGEASIENTPAYQNFISSAQSDVHIQTYLFDRLKAAQDLSYYRDGNWYGWLEAYRGGMWLMRNRYEKGQDARTFIKNHVRRSDKTGKLHLIKYPDGSIHEAYYVLLNELDLLEASLKNDPKAKIQSV